MRAWRAGVWVAVVVLLHHSAVRQHRAEQFAYVNLDLARHFFPAAATVGPVDSQGVQRVGDAAGQALGSVLTTSPQTDERVGYSGPNNLLVALDSEGRVAGMELVASGDTPTHVQAVLGDAAFWSSFLGWLPVDEMPPPPRVVSGSTLTSLAMAEALQQRLGAVDVSLRFPEAVTLPEARSLFPEAFTLETVRDRKGWLSVTDAAGNTLGYVLRTAPHSDNVRGYRGPTECLVAVAPDATRVVGIRLRSSYDTEDYVERIRRDRGYLKQLANLTLNEWAALDIRDAGFEGVSGATQTSYAVTEGLRRRFASETGRGGGRKVGGWGRLTGSEGWMVALVGAGVWMGFSAWRGRLGVRRLWHIVVVFGLGLGLGGFLSVALLVGWARQGLQSEVSLGLVALAVAALVVPWAMRRPLYCHHLCAHGVVQGWLSRWRPARRPVRGRWEAWLRRIPSALLLVLLGLGFSGWQGNLAAFEPFDAWVLGAGAAISAIVAVVGLGISVWIPMAYCRYGCPTGALLSFARSTGGADRWSLRDTVAGIGLVMALVILIFGAGPERRGIRSVIAPGLRIGGTGFGTTWTVSTRASMGDAGRLQARLQEEVDRVEFTVSHWRSNSFTAGFNAAETLQPMVMPKDVAAVLREALSIAGESGGALDVTVGPLVAAQGFGPKPAAEPEAARSPVGWDKLRVDWDRLTVAKADSGVQLDFGALLQGYTADRLAEMMRAEGIGEALVEVGGELRALGVWDVAVENPALPGRPLLGLALHDDALAVSGVYRGSSMTAEGVKQVHLLDPRTGRSVGHDTLLAAVVASSGIAADGWATALLVLGREAGLELAERRGMAAVMVWRAPDGALRWTATSAMRSRLE